MTRSKILSGLALACLVALGCGGGGGSTVTGQVTFNGKPLEKGYINFYPSDGKGAPVGAEVTNGRYTAKKVVPGKTKVVVTSTTAGQASDSMGTGIQDAKKTAAPTVDTLTDNADGNSQTHDIPSGDFELNLTLKASASSDGKVR